MYIVIDIPHIEPIVFIQSNDKNIYQYFMMKFSPYCKYCCTINAHEKKKEFKFFRIIYNIKKEYDWYDENTFLQTFSSLTIGRALSVFMHYILKSNRQHVVMHGGAVCHNHHGIALLGESFAGKTTLTSYLVGNGFQYYTDDLIIYNSNNHILTPFPNPVHLRKDALLLLQNHGVTLPVKEYSGFSYERYIFFPQAQISPCKLETFILLNRQNTIQPKIRLLQKDESFHAIMRHSYAADCIQYYIIAAKDISRTCAVYELTYSHLEDAKMLIERIFK